MNKITPKISGNFVISVAEMYTDFNRAIMEYIDNSIDSSEHYLDNSTNKYKEKIEIKITIEENKQIIIQDNCQGIKDLNSLIQEIGHSEKKADFVTNGQFGFGIYSFMAGCDSMEFYSKHPENQECYYLKIPKKSFEKAKLDDVEIEKAQANQKNIIRGTEVILSSFKDDIWKDVDKEKLKNYIANHFELLLRKRKNISICINDDEVKPYDYSKIEGKEWEEKLKKASYTPRKQKKRETSSRRNKV